METVRVSGDFVFVVVWEDHHSDSAVEVFSNEEVAVAWAREKAREFDRFEQYTETPLTESMVRDGWIFYCTYSSESDGIRVVRRMIDAQVV